MPIWPVKYKHAPCRWDRDKELVVIHLELTTLYESALTETIFIRSKVVVIGRIVVVYLLIMNIVITAWLCSRWVYLMS